MTTRRDPTKNRDLNAQRAQVVNPLTSEELNPHLDESVNAARALRVNPNRRDLETLADETGQAADTYDVIMSMKGKEGLRLFLEAETGGGYGGALKAYVDVDPTNNDPASGKWLDLTKDAFGTSDQYNATNDWIGGEGGCSETYFTACDKDGVFDGANLLKFEITLGDSAGGHYKLVASTKGVA